MFGINLGGQRKQVSDQIGDQNLRSCSLLPIITVGTPSDAAK
jgi:hypothetical protein